MARTQKALQPVDERIASLLALVVERAGISQRELAAETGMSQNRLGTILRRQSPPATVGEIGTIAAAFGITASAIIAAAESGDVGRLLETVQHESKHAYDLAAHEGEIPAYDLTDEGYDGA